MHFRTFRLRPRRFPSRHGAQQRLHDRGVLRRSMDDQPTPVWRRRGLRRDRLDLHLRVWTATDKTELRPVGQGSELRSELVDVRNNAETILAARDEDPQMAQLLSRLDDVVTNFRKITSINRNVGFFTTGYNWMIQIIPALIIAPAFIERRSSSASLPSRRSPSRLLSPPSAHRDPAPIPLELCRGRGAAQRACRGGRIRAIPEEAGVASSVILGHCPPLKSWY